jgi:hypothetical protein
MGIVHFIPEFTDCAAKQFKVQSKNRLAALSPRLASPFIGILPVLSTSFTSLPAAATRPYSPTCPQYDGMGKMGGRVVKGTKKFRVQSSEFRVKDKTIQKRTGILPFAPICGICCKFCNCKKRIFADCALK